MDEQAIKEIVGFGGYVDTEDSVPGHPAVAVNLDRSLVTDAVLVALERLSQLHYLILSQTLVTDKVMEVLLIHPEIKRLNVSGTLITDSGMKCLKHGKALEELYLGNKISDKGFQHVKHLTKLKVLSLEDTRVTAKGLRHIAALANLEYLLLSSRQVSTESLCSIGRLPRLKTMNVLGDGKSSIEPVVAKLKIALPNVRIEW
jgi:hypothetical protein